MSGGQVAALFGAVIPLLVYGLLCRALPGFTRRDAVLAVAAGAVVVALVWLAGNSLLEILPASPQQSPWLAAFFYGAGLEESFKLAALVALWRAARPRSPRDFLPLATGIACGFAAAENVLVLWSAAHPATALLERMTLALPAHVAYAVVMAGLLARTDPPLAARGIVAALLAAIVLHGANDVAAFVAPSFVYWAIAAVLASVAVAVWWRRLSA